MRNGRITNILSKLNLKRIYSIEPSDAFKILEKGRYNKKNNIKF